MQNQKSKLHTYIYKLYLEDGSTYIGLRHSEVEPELDTKYLGSSKYLDKSKIIKKEILISGFFSDKELSDLETFYIKKDKEENPLNMNFTLGAGALGVYNYSKLHSDEIIDVLKQRARERWDDPEIRAKLEYQRRIQNTPEVKACIAKTVHQTCDDLEWKKQHSEKIKAALAKPETRAKLDAMYASRRGKPGANKGYHYSEEGKEKNSLNNRQAFEIYTKYKDRLGIPYREYRHIIKGIQDYNLREQAVLEYLNKLN